MEISKKNIFIALLSVLIVYFFLANFFKTYKSEVELLIVPQNDKTVLMRDQVLENAKHIPSTISFFDALAEENIILANQTVGMDFAERKSFWNDKLKTEIIDNSGIIKFTAYDDTSEQAENIAVASATKNAIILSSYYDIKKDIAIRIIDGPITNSVGGYASIRTIVSSLTFVIILIVIFYLMAELLNKKVTERIIPIAPGILSKDAFSLKKNVEPEPRKEEKKIEEVYAIPTKEIPKSEPVVEKVSEFVSTERKASAPGNLPIADTSIMSMFGATKIGTGYKIQEPKAEPEKKADKPAVYREATEEEVKERLNRLLGGS